MRGPHIVIVNQNAPLEMDLRPRREAETLAGAGYEVTLVGGCRDPQRVREMTAGSVALRLYRQPPGGAGVAGQIREQSQAMARAVAGVQRAARRAPVAAVHAGNPPDNMFLVGSLLRGVQPLRPRFVFDQHDAAPVLLSENFSSGSLAGPLSSIAHAMERRSFEAARLVVFANQEYRNRAVRERLLHSDSEVVLNGWALPDASPDPTWRAGAEHLLAYVGTIGEQDNVDRLVDAVAVLAARLRLRVVVAGEGSALAAVKLRARQRSIGDRFHWLGLVTDRQRLAALVRSADVCIAPEVDSEFNRLATFVKVIEYMSAGAAVAAHRLPQTESLAGATIAYAEDMTAAGLAAAIADLLASPERRRRLGDAARLRFDEQINWERAGAPRLVAAYDRLFAAYA